MLPGEIYHIYNRGNNRETIFKEERNYQYFLNRFCHYLEDLVQVHAYCLMPNHFHLLVTIADYDTDLVLPSGGGARKLSPVEKGFKNFFISYAKTINKYYRRTGSLFQYKYKRKLVQSEAQFFATMIYIHRNPIQAGLVPQCEDWKYSSYADHLDAFREGIITEYNKLFGSVQVFELCHRGVVDFKSLLDF